jgi:hypothetical protein
MLPASVPGKMVHLERSHLRFELGNHGLELGEASFMGFLGFDEELILREPHQVSPKLVDYPRSGPDFKTYNRSADDAITDVLHQK